MMKSIATEIKVGITVIAAAVILLLGIIWVKEYKFNVERYRYSVLFPNIGSLEIGDQVSVLGVKKGEVEKIRISGNYVLVTFKIMNDVQLKKDAKFTVMNIGLMGERFINIQPGESDQPLDLSVPVHGYYDTGIPEVMGMMGAAIDELRHLVAIMEGTIGTPSATESMQRIIANLDKISTDWQYLSQQNREKLTQAVTDLASTTSRIKGILDANEEKFEETLDNINEGSQKFVEIASKLDTLSQSVHKLLGNLESGEGTLGRALKNDSLYNQLVSATVNLDSLITDFKKHPKKYVKLSIF